MSSKVEKQWKRLKETAPVFPLTAFTVPDWSQRAEQRQHIFWPCFNHTHNVYKKGRKGDNTETWQFFLTYAFLFVLRAFSSSDTLNMKSTLPTGWHSWALEQTNWLPQMISISKAVQFKLSSVDTAAEAMVPNTFSHNVATLQPWEVNRQWGWSLFSSFSLMATLL